MGLPQSSQPVSERQQLEAMSHIADNDLSRTVDEGDFITVKHEWLSGEAIGLRNPTQEPVAGPPSRLQVLGWLEPTERQRNTYI